MAYRIFDVMKVHDRDIFLINNYSENRFRDVLSIFIQFAFL